MQWQTHFEEPLFELHFVQHSCDGKLTSVEAGLTQLFFLDMAIVHTNRVDLQGYPVTFEIRVSVDTETFVSEKESFRILKFLG